MAALTDLVKWLDVMQVPSMIIGGVAASVLGRPRLTQDVDALAILSEEAWAGAISTAASHQILPRIENPLDFARRSRVLLMRHAESGIDIDLTFARLSFEQTAIHNSEVHDIGGVRVRLPRVEDLLIMKAVARRPKDLEDIEGLLAAHPEADVAAVRRWVREFAAATGMSDMLDDFDEVVTRSKSKR
ncbi:MAG TPA: nucleotidyltransferase [Steroidobacteraceae bacterium]|nr:nucleotidyltransferase [Steroidobacteraceae bacterium]